MIDTVKPDDRFEVRVTVGGDIAARHGFVSRKSAQDHVKALTRENQRVANYHVELIERAYDPVRRDQSKTVDSAGVLRYSADGSEVFPGATGVRRV